MKKLGLLIVLLLTSQACLSQSLSVAPYSMKLWGQTGQMGSASGNYGMISIHYFFTYKDNERFYSGSPKDKLETSTRGKFIKNQNTLAISIKPLSFRDIARAGVMYSFNKFPSTNGSHLNFTLEIGKDITNNIRLSYRHISNGFGIQNDYNPGLDTFQITIK